MQEKSYKIPLLLALTSLFWFSLYTYVPILVPYCGQIGASALMVGNITGSYGLVQMILRIPLGILSDKIQKRKIFIILGFGVGMLSALGLFLSTTPEGMLIFRAMAGVSATVWVSFTVLYSSYFDQNATSRSIGMINSFNYLGQMAGTLSGGFFAAWFGKPSTFLMAIAAGGLGLVLSLFIVEERKVDRPPMKIKDVLNVGRDRNLMVVSFLAILCQLLTYGTALGFTADLARDVLQATDDQLGVLSTLAVLPGVFAAALGGTFFARVLGERKTLAVGFFIVGLSCVAIPYMNNIYLIYLWQFIGGFGRGMSFPMLMALSIRSVGPNLRATAMGFFQAIYGLGMYLGPVIVGLFKDMTGDLTVSFWLVSLIAVLGGVLSLMLVRAPGRQAGAPPAVR